jgi:hypothetical protein
MNNKNELHFCDNMRFGFICMCNFEIENKGDNEYACEFCGIYKASKANCNKCEKL